MKELIVEKQRDVNRVMTPVVQDRMTSGYEACNLESGAGMWVRMKSHMTRHVATTKSVMFTDASVQLLDQLNQLQVGAYSGLFCLGSLFILSVGSSVHLLVID